jgi:hypothetical protein
VGVHPLEYLGYPLGSLPLCGQCPAPKHYPPYLPSWKLLLARQLNQSLGLRLRRRCLAAQTVQRRRKVERVGQAIGMRQLLG